MAPQPICGRQELEEIWRGRLEKAHRRYSASNKAYRRLLRRPLVGLPLSPDSGLARARKAESAALAEFRRVLQIFRELTVHNELPKEQSAHLVALVDDDESIRDSFRALLRSAGYRVVAFESAEAFLESGVEADAGCLILDFWMPGMSGLDLQVRLNTGHSRVPIIFITAHDDGSFCERAVQAGAVDILHKPFAPAILLSTLQKALAYGGKEHG